VTNGVLELHWERDRGSALQCQLYRRTDLGQLCFVDAYEGGPFEGALEAASWLTRAMVRAEVIPTR
jgi:hypothetical protein